MSPQKGGPHSARTLSRASAREATGWKFATLVDRESTPRSHDRSTAPGAVRRSAHLSLMVFCHPLWHGFLTDLAFACLDTVFAEYLDSRTGGACKDRSHTDVLCKGGSRTALTMMRPGSPVTFDHTLDARKLRHVRIPPASRSLHLGGPRRRSWPVRRGLWCLLASG